MRVLFVYTNINGFHYDNYHFGVASLVSSTIKAGHDAKVVVLTEMEHYAQVAEAMKSFQPDVVGFSSVSSQYIFAKELAGLVKSISPSTLTVCGGVHPTLSANSLLECPELDGFFRGECEIAFVDFLNKLERKESYKDQSNFSYVENGKIISNPLAPLINDLDVLPEPDKTLYPYYESAIKTTRIAPFFFTRGCPFTCTYCFNQSFAELYNRKRNFPRFRSVDRCIQEIEAVVEKYNSEIDFVIIGDDIFGPDKTWREDFCDKYKRRILDKYGTPFDILMRVEMFQNHELARKLKDSGCFKVSFGVESGDEKQRQEALDRQMSDKKLIKAFQVCRDVGIESNSINIIGFPGETEEMIKKTVKLNRILRPTTSGVNIFYPYKGTPLGDKCFSDDLVDLEKFATFSAERRDSVLKFPEKHLNLLLAYQRDWDGLVYPVYTRKGFRSRLTRLLRQMGLLPLASVVNRELKRFVRPNSRKLKRYSIGNRPGRAA